MTATAEQIQAALGKLDASNDNHWTAEGLPRLETVRFLASDQSVTREQVTQAAPQFSRAAPVLTAGGVPTPTPTANPAVNAPAAAATPAQVLAEQAATAGLPPPSAPEGLPPGQTLTAVTPSPSVQPAPEEIESLEAELADVRSELEQIAKAEAEVKKAKAERQTKEADLLIRIEKLQPKHSNQHAIMNYLRSQEKQREIRTQQIQNARKFETDAGVKIVDLLPKRSPLDSAMARKTARGTKRPGT